MTEQVIDGNLTVRPYGDRYLLINESDWPIAEMYNEREAARLAYEHNQHATLVEQRDRLSLAAYRAVTRMANLSRWLEKNDARVLGEIVAECLADLSVAIPAGQITTIEQSVKKAGEIER